MSPHWTDRPRAAAAMLLLLGAAVLSGCAGLSRPEPAPPTAGPDPQAVARHEAALSALRAGDEAQAEGQWRMLADTYPEFAGPLVNLALLHARRNELAPATVLLERAVVVCLQCAAPWNELGVVQRRQGRFAEAEQSYLQAIAADDTYANAHFNLAVLYELYLQRPELALAAYGRYRETGGETGGTGAVADVDKWISDLERRTGVVERAARLEGAP